MGRTIKQLADELGVSKTAVRNYMDEDFRAKYTEKDRKGVITINEDGCKVIAETYGKQCKEAQNNANRFAESTANTENITIPMAVWTMMEEQLKKKDEQIESLSAALENTTASLKAAQALHAGTFKMIPDKKSKGLGWFKKKEEQVNE